MKIWKITRNHLTITRIINHNKIRLMKPIMVIGGREAVCLSLEKLLLPTRLQILKVIAIRCLKI